jgi:hypothetical protein
MSYNGVELSSSCFVLRVAHLVVVFGLEANMRLRGHHRGALPFVVDVVAPGAGRVVEQLHAHLIVALVG